MATCLDEAGAEGDAFEELVEGERGQQGFDGAGGVGHAQRNANQHRVQRNARLQNLTTTKYFISHTVNMANFYPLLSSPF